MPHVGAGNPLIRLCRFVGALLYRPTQDTPSGSMTGLVRWPDLVCMPEWRQEPMSVRNWNAYAGTSRPAVSKKRLLLASNGNLRYQFKTPYRDGTTHVFFEPLDFIAHLPALVPKPRVNLTRFHGVFASNAKHRALVTPPKRGRGNKARVVEERPSPAERRASMTWAKRLKRVCNIDIKTCSECTGVVKVIACIEDPKVIRQILDNLRQKA